MCRYVNRLWGFWESCSKMENKKGCGESSKQIGYGGHAKCSMNTNCWDSLQLRGSLACWPWMPPVSSQNSWLTSFPRPHVARKLSCWFHICSSTHFTQSPQSTLGQRASSLFHSGQNIYGMLGPLLERSHNRWLQANLLKRWHANLSNLINQLS